MTPSEPRMNPTPIDEIAALLGASIGDVFSTLFQLDTRLAPPGEQRRGAGEPLITGSVRLVGDVSGIVRIEFATPLARRLAVRMLEMTAAEPLDADMLDSVVAELTNMIVGAVKSRLCDAGTTCVLTLPAVRHDALPAADTPASGVARCLTFQCGSETISVRVLIQPPL